MLERPKHEVFTFPHFIQWLERQPADRTYEWPATRYCLAAIYIQDQTGCHPLESVSQTHASGARVRYDEVMGGAAAYHYIGMGGHPADPEDWTCGKALERAKKWMATWPQREEAKCA